MKSYATLFILALLVVTSCAPEHEMKLTGNIEGLKKGTLILQKFEDTLLTSIDSLSVDGDSNFRFSVSVPSPEIYYIYLRLKNGDLLDERIPFFAEEGEVNVATNLKNFGTEFKVTGSTNQDKFEEYKKLMKRYIDKNLDIVSLKLKAMAEKNDSMYFDYENQEQKVLRSKYLASVNYALSQKDFEIAPYIMVHEVEGIAKKYLDTVYNSLPQNIKNSKYGEDLESLLLSKRSVDTTAN